MEHIKNHLQVVGGQQAVTSSSRTLNEISNLQPQEREMLNLKYAGKPFGKMGQDELRLHAKSLILKINIIAGWVIPDDETYYRILSQQFEKKLTESFPTVNPEEFEFAFRNDTTVQDWGKAMNLSLIDEVMIPYLSKRRELSQIEEVKKPMLIERKEDMTDEAMESFLVDNARLVKENKITVEFIPTLLYDWLEKEGKLKLTVQEKWDYMAKAAAYRQGKLGERAATDPEARQSLESFMQMKESGFVGTEKEILTSIAKKMCLYDYLLKIEG
jgi:hypothetical protein